jgi:hypothetical protein
MVYIIARLYPQLGLSYALRIRTGALSKARLNARLKAAADEKPVRAAMSAIGILVSSTSLRAAPSRNLR